MEVSSRVKEVFRNSKKGLDDDLVQSVDKIYRELEDNLSQASALTVSEGEDRKKIEAEYIDEAERLALSKLTILMQEKLLDLRKEINQQKETRTILKRKNRFYLGEKIYPNEPCPCGSGKKFKRCCGLLKDRKDSPLYAESEADSEREE